MTEDGLARAFARRRRRGALARCFVAMRRHAADERRRRATLTRVAARIANRQLSSAWVGWCATVRVIRRARRGFEVFMDRRHHRALSDVVCGWSDAAASVRRRRRDGARAAARVAARRQRCALKDVLVGWDADVARARRLRREAARCAARIGRRVFASSMSRWRTWARENARRRTHAVRAIARDALRAETAAFRAWRHAIAERSRRLRQTSGRAAARFTRRYQAASFRQWIFSVGASRRLQSAAKRTLAKIISRGVARAFARWHDAALEGKRVRSLLRKFAARMRSRDLAGAWSGWIAGMAARRRATRLAKKLAATVYDRVASKAFYRWRGHHIDVVRARRLETKAREFFATKHVRACLRGWRREKSAKTRRRHVAAMVTTRTTRRGMFAGFSRWCDFRRESRRLRVALAKTTTRWNARLLAAGLSGWVAGHARVTQGRRAAAKVVARITLRRQAEAFSGWSLATTDRARARRLLVRVAARLRQRFSAECFEGWRAAHARRRRGRAALHAVAARWTSRTMSASFTKWHDVSTTSIERRGALLRGAFVKMARSLAAAGFVKWRRTANENRRDRRARLVATNRVVQRWSGRRQSTAFDAWRRRHAEVRRLSVTLRRACAKFDNGKGARAFASWVASHRSRTGASRLLSKIVNRGLASSLNRWIAETAEVVRARRMLVRAHGMSTRFEYRGKARAFVEWRKVCLRANHLHRLMRNTLGRKFLFAQRDCFVDWIRAVDVKRAAMDNIRNCLTRKRVAQRWFLRWYWDAFDSDIQVALANILGSGENAANDVYSPGEYPTALRHVAQSKTAGGGDGVGESVDEGALDDDEAGEEDRRASGLASEFGFRGRGSVRGKSVIKRLTSESVEGRSPYVSLGTGESPSVASRADRLQSSYDSPDVVGEAMIQSGGAAGEEEEDVEMSVEEMADTIFAQGNKTMNAKSENDVRQAKMIMANSKNLQRAKTRKAQLTFERGTLFVRGATEYGGGRGGGGVESFESRYDRVIQGNGRSAASIESSAAAS